MKTIDDLEKIFAKHAKKYEEDNMKYIENFRQQYPGEPLPDHINDEFNLPKSLALICCEIIKIRDKTGP